MTFDAKSIFVAETLREWFLYWVGTTLGLAVLVLAVSIVSVLLAYRSAGGKMLAGELQAFATDLFSLSPRRVGALAKLTFVESYRRKLLAVFVVFGLLFMFAGWFMGGDASEITKDDVKVYVSFVLRTITWLTLPVVLLLSCFGIPEDIRLRSLHTVVTKPARRLEVVLGRIIGYVMVGTMVLVVMSTVGYIWIVRQIPASAQDQVLICRVPIHGELTFLDRNGEPAAKGVNVGDIWEFRSYIEGATKARAIWTFSGMGEHILDSKGNLHIENQFLAFRSYKGDMNQSLLYDYQFVNPETKKTFTIEARPVSENRGVQDIIPRKLAGRGDDQASYDLIKDFVTSKGTLTVEVSCIDREQYLGMARPDLFIRMPDSTFLTGFFKAAFGIELVMILVVLFGVTASTFLKGPIAMITAGVLLLLGGEKTHVFMNELVSGTFKGGGFLESIYRIYTHLNPTIDLPGQENIAVKAMKGVDFVLTCFLWLCKHVIPQLNYFNMTEYVANGFDVPFDSSLAPFILITFGYMIPCVLLGYFALRIRELESK